MDLLDKGVVHTDRLTQIIDDLLQLSKLETTGGEIEKDSTNLQSIIDIAIQQCHESASKKSIDLVIHNNDRQVLCNANLLTQAIKNLVENAIKYSSESTRFTITSDEDNGHINIHVSDEGPGIDEKHMSKLFQRFYRVDAARSRQMGGTGRVLQL